MSKMKFKSYFYGEFSLTYFSKEYKAYLLFIFVLFTLLFLLIQNVLKTSVWTNFAFILIVISILWIRATTHSKVESHKKKFKGQIEISTAEILWNGQPIHWQEISKFHFVLSNYKGDYYHSINSDLVNKLASGINNPIQITLKHGTSFSGYVFRKSKYELALLKELIHEIVRLKKVSLADALKLIGPSSYKEIQEFKKWYSELSKSPI